jgi:hypothetical protein
MRRDRRAGNDKARGSLVTLGATGLRVSSHLPAMEYSKLTKPVMLPPRPGEAVHKSAPRSPHVSIDRYDPHTLKRDINQVLVGLIDDESRREPPVPNLLKRLGRGAVHEHAINAQ